MNEPQKLYLRLKGYWNPYGGCYAKYRAEIDALDAAISTASERRVVEFKDAPEFVLMGIHRALDHFGMVAVLAWLQRNWCDGVFYWTFSEEIKNENVPRCLHFRKSGIDESDFKNDPDFWRPRVIVEPLFDKEVQVTFIEDSTRWKTGARQWQ